jgi:hypothetical protein
MCTLLWITNCNTLRVPFRSFARDDGLNDVFHEDLGCTLTSKITWCIGTNGRFYFRKVCGSELKYVIKLSSYEGPIAHAGSIHIGLANFDNQRIVAKVSASYTVSKTA